jgi:hypothetical protein
MSEDITTSFLEAAQANTLAAIQRQVKDWNEVLKSNYLTAFDNWSQSVLAGRSDNSNPPHPPKAYEVGYFVDPTTGPGSIGPYGDTPVEWAYPKLGVNLVCAMPPVPGIPGVNHNPAGVAMIGPRNWENYFQMMPGDTIPVNPATGLSPVFPGRSADDVTGLFQKYDYHLAKGYKWMAALP